MLGVSVPMMMALTIIYCFKWAFTINLPNRSYDLRSIKS